MSPSRALQTFAKTLKVPDALSELDRWGQWRRERVGDCETKIPYSITGRKASSTDLTAWGTFEDACAALQADPQRYSGLGFVFAKSDGLAGIDLDDALDAAGTVKAWARGIVERFSDCYMEISPSGSGVKIWAR